MLFILEFVGNLASFIGYPFIWLLIHKTTSWSWREILLYYLQRLYFDGLYRVAGTYIFSLFFIFCMFPYKFFHLICENFVRLIFNCLKPAFESRWIKRQCNLKFYFKTIVFFISFVTSFVSSILWWTDLDIIIYSKLRNKRTFET